MMFKMEATPFGLPSPEAEKLRRRPLALSEGESALVSGLSGSLNAQAIRLSGTLLQVKIFANGLLSEHAPDREGDVDGTKDDEDAVSDLLNRWNVQLRNAEHGSDLLPAEAGVGDKHADTEDVEDGPHIAGRGEDLVLQGVNVAAADLGHCRVVCPEELQLGDAVSADEHGRWADVVRSEFVCVTETELEQVDRHENEQCQACDGQF